MTTERSRDPAIDPSADQAGSQGDVPPPPPSGEEPGHGVGQRDGSQQKRRLPFIVELPLLVLLAFALAVVLKTFLVQAFYIPSASMVPTLEVNDRILVNKVVFDLREPQRGEVIVFHEEGVGPGGVSGTLNDLAAGLGIVPPAQRDFVKRIIGLPGETLEVRDGVVYIDGERLRESTVEQGGYLQARSSDDFGPVEIPRGEYFLMGDNRPNSADSRSSLGTIEREEIVGRAFVVIWPPRHLDTLASPEYDLQPSSDGEAVSLRRSGQPPAERPGRVRAPAA